MLKRAVVLAGVLFALTLPAGAEAHARHSHRAVHDRPRTNPTQAALALAFHYWPTVPCSGRVATVMGTPPGELPSLTPPGVAAVVGARLWSMASFVAGEGPPGFACTIWINPEAWPTERDAASTGWPVFSIGLIHEVGHFLGFHDVAFTTGPYIMDEEPNPDVAFTGWSAPGWP